MKHSAELSQARLKELNAVLDRLEDGRDPRDILVDNASFQQKFRISRRTAFNWRRKNLIKSLLIERIIYYRLSEIRLFLQRCEEQ